MADSVELVDVSHVYVTSKDAVLSVDQINLTLKKGAFASLIGPSGCGKTTILSMIAGLIPPTAGTVLRNGRPVSGPSIKAGYMMQQDYLFPWLTIWENVTLGLRLAGMLNAEHEAHVRHLLDEVGLLSAQNRYPHQLSGGMRQRAALVRTLATRPDLLLLDEPFSALDYYTKLQLEDLLADMLENLGITALLVTHDIAEAIAMSDVIWIMRKNPGRIRRELVIPDRVRAASPLQARKLPEFHALFDEVWRLFDPDGNGGGR